MIAIVTCFGFARVAFPNLEVLYYRCEVLKEREKRCNVKHEEARKRVRFGWL